MFMPTVPPDSCLEMLLDKARITIDGIYDPAPKPQEPHEILSKMHERYNQLRRVLCDNRGEHEDQIISLCSQLIGDVADVAVLFERNRQKV